MGTDDTGFITDSGECCESSVHVDDCGVCRGDGRSCGRLVQGTVAAAQGESLGALLGILQDGLPGAMVTQAASQGARRLQALKLHSNKLWNSGATNSSELKGWRNVMHTRELRNAGLLADSTEMETTSVVYHVENGSSVVYSSKALAAAFVNSTAVAMLQGVLRRESPLPTISVQVRH